jgi:hypothetical protein
MLSVYPPINFWMPEPIFMKLVPRYGNMTGKSEHELDRKCMKNILFFGSVL